MLTWAVKLTPSSHSQWRSDILIFGRNRETARVCSYKLKSTRHIESSCIVPVSLVLNTSHKCFGITKHQTVKLDRKFCKIKLFCWEKKPFICNGYVCTIDPSVIRCTDGHEWDGQLFLFGWTYFELPQSRVSSFCTKNSYFFVGQSTSEMLIALCSKSLRT